MTILDEIVAHKRTEIEHLKDVQSPPLCTNDFTALFHPKPSLIAELKAASPSEGIIDPDFDPLKKAAMYIAGEANAISVLTDHKYFGGSFEVLAKVRAMTEKPLLCKEFIIEPKQIRVARAAGADMVLLIVKILNSLQLSDLKATIERWGMKAVVEVQNQEELDKALEIDPEILLINNRNLSSFEIDHQTTENLLNGIPDHVRVISASGISDPGEVRAAPGRIDGFLIGTTLMRSEDPAKFLRECRET